MPGLPWFKHKTGERHKAAIKFMTPAGRCLYYALCEIAGELGLDGVVHISPGVPYTDDQLADEAHIPVAEVRPAIEHLVRVGVLEEDSDHLYLADFPPRVGDNSAERVRRHRAKQQGATNRQSNGSETLPKRNGNVQVTAQIRDLETDPDPDSRTDNALIHPDGNSTSKPASARGSPQPIWTAALAKASRLPREHLRDLQDGQAVWDESEEALALRVSVDRPPPPEVQETLERSLRLVTGSKASLVFEARASPGA